ncbi:PREDICTED: S-adenosylmethionine mitochondrial carrier protein-like isoform X1 [Polistes canadensis]|uniref:S-adenosylmethionine mitochondrial carrier protein-like isoform X1 n=1 Tax=Polistes canadensis TaxID=91411 RepID=UPI000718C736|nr:PREDICTED: S-adenosylmethionine mitochondrial carrier protein-like isoform X1 [Polistes canadensis]
MTSYEKNLKNFSGRNILFTSIFAGASAGICVDTILFPIDTIKTRLQSQHGFLQSGGFKGLYRGLYPVLIGSTPTAALFFVTYESTKVYAQPLVSERYRSLIHMGAASLSEMVACIVRVPVEVMKQRKQAYLLDQGNFSMKFLYRGYWSTVLRDMPFSLIQFPLWEYFKNILSLYVQRDVYPFESATCGSLAGAFSAALTTPLDVAKTRIMLANKMVQSSDLKLSTTLRAIYTKEGLNGLFAGVNYRIMWISIGGFIFFGVYEEAKLLALDAFKFTNL